MRYLRCRHKFVFTPEFREELMLAKAHVTNFFKRDRAVNLVDRKVFKKHIYFCNNLEWRQNWKNFGRAKPKFALQNVKNRAIFGPFWSVPNFDELKKKFMTPKLWP